MVTIVKTIVNHGQCLSDHFKITEHAKSQGKYEFFQYIK